MHVLGPLRPVADQQYDDTKYFQSKLDGMWTKWRLDHVGDARLAR